jgi:hypothetical protein
VHKVLQYLKDHVGEGYLKDLVGEGSIVEEIAIVL